MAKNLLTIFNAKRPDIKVIGFIDSFGRRTSEAFETLTPNDLHQKDYDYIIITLLNYLDQLQFSLSKIPQQKLRLNLVANLAYYPPYLSHGFIADAEKMNSSLII